MIGLRLQVRAGDCPALLDRGMAVGDNDAKKSFCSLLQKKVLDRRRWRTREELRIGDRHLDPEDLPPPSTGSPGPFDPNEYEGHHEPGREPRGLIPELPPVRAAAPFRWGCVRHVIPA